MKRGAWQAAVHGVAKSWIWHFHFHFHVKLRNGHMTYFWKQNMNTGAVFNPSFNNMWTMNLQMCKLVLEKAEKPEIKLPASAGSLKKQESSRKTSVSALLTMPKPLTVWITINCGKFWKRWEYQTIRPASWEICMQIRKQQLELDTEQQTGSNRKRSMSRLFTLLI